MDHLREKSRWLARAILGVLFVLLLVPATVTVAVASGRYPLNDVIIRQLPMLFYAWALWSIRTALNGYAVGGSLDLRTGQSLQYVGLALFLGGLSNVFVVPMIV